MKDDFLLGLKCAIPIVLGYIAIGIAYGMMANQAGMSLPATQSLSLFVYSGASEMAAANMIGQKMSMVAIVVTTFILGLRHLILSTCVMDKLRHVPLVKRILLSFFVTDETFAVFMSDTRVKHTFTFFFGLGIGAYLAWNFGTVVGSIAGNLLPPFISKCFSISLYSMFIALLVPGIKTRNICMVVILTACISMILSFFISSSWNIIVSTLLGAFIGMFITSEEELS